MALVKCTKKMAVSTLGISSTAAPKVAEPSSSITVHSTVESLSTTKLKPLKAKASTNPKT